MYKYETSATLRKIFLRMLDATKYLQHNETTSA